MKQSSLWLPKRKEKALTKPYNPWNLKTEITVVFKKYCFHHCQMLNSEHHGNQSLLPLLKILNWRENEPKSQTQSWRRQHTHSVTTFQQHIHNFLIKSTKKPFSRRKQCNWRRKAENIQNMQRKIREWSKNEKMTWWWWESLWSGDPVAVKQLATMPALAENLHSSAPRFLPWDIKTRILLKKLKENWVDRRRRKAGVVHLRKSSRV